MNATILAFLLLLPTPKLSVQDKSCIAYAIWYEARGEPIKGQRAVMDVIVNRTKQRKITACQVIKQPYQFSFYKNEVIRPTQSMLTNFKKVRSISQVLPDGTVYYHADYVSPGWAKKKKRITQIGSHIFYKEN